MLEKDLQEIGLNEKEAKVYLSALELGQSTVQDISKKAGVNRATTYFVIEALMKSGLMSSFHKAKKQFFIAADPDRLIEMLEQEKNTIEKKEDGLKKLLPQLQSINNKQKDRPVVRYYENKDGIEAMEKDFIKENGIAVYTVFSEDSAKKVWTKEDQDRYAKKLIAQKTTRIGLYTCKGSAEAVIIPNDKLVQLPSDKYNFASGITVRKNMVALTTYKSNLGAILIESEDIAKTIQTLIQLAMESKNISKK